MSASSSTGRVSEAGSSAAEQTKFGPPPQLESLKVNRLLHWPADGEVVSRHTLYSAKSHYHSEKLPDILYCTVTMTKESMQDLDEI
jgi:hypothetical protein